MAPKKSRNTEKLPKNIKKHRPPRTTPLSVWTPSRPFSRLLASPWALLALELLSVPLLGAADAFCGVGSAVLTNFSKIISLKVTKHEKIYSLATTKHNSINALVPKVWTITLSPTGSFKLLTLSWKNILSVFQWLTEVYSPFSKLSTTIS